mmetsp:Transcript_10919/g.15023  ORF Transcript_10919/g.15023 Transcript_10919/m.15023 type:complete len:416 (+) Transcript_10919:40-1287(+)
MSEQDLQLESGKSNNGWNFFDSVNKVGQYIKDSVVNQYTFVIKEIDEEIIKADREGAVSFFRENWRNFIHVPFLPCLSKPGWLLRYIFGPYNFALFESLYSDFFAGITVAMTLIPQALSYATLANLPVINGIYTAILPGMAYVIFGTSMHLGLGPVALVSLLTGQLVTQYGIDYVKHPQDAVDFASEAALAVGTIFAVLSVLNLGDMINLISHPVMSGFTTAAACYIGLSQIKNAFGFSPSNVPQTGMVGYDENHEVMKWFANHWNDVYYAGKTTKGRTFRNHYATTICLSIFFPLLLVQMIRNTYKPTPERKKSWLYNTWQILSSLLPFASIIIAAHVAFEIKTNSQQDKTKPHYDYYADTLKVVGTVQGGLNFFRAPRIKYNFLKLIGDVIPLTLVSFMESYSVAHRISTQKK